MSIFEGMNASSDLLERYAHDVEGVLGCFDRVVVTGTLTEVAHPDAMAAVAAPKCSHPMGESKSHPKALAFPTTPAF